MTGHHMGCGLRGSSDVLVNMNVYSTSTPGNEQ
jgi:hypothetical protein